MLMTQNEEILRRRTFAIISHPDAGKTTLTEKLLYVGGAIHQAGEVKGKAGTKAATSDWMKMEQERGISITSSVMQFEYKDLRVNLLDTPGHKDFSEDTYRTLTAADSAVMLIDVAKGVELQTRKLYEVCRYRKMPIFAFINKVDREGKVPLELIDEIESTLQMRCYPITWPIGIGGRFKALYHRHTHDLYLYQMKDGELYSEVVKTSGPSDSKIDQLIGDEELVQNFRDDLELLDGALGPFDVQEFLDGKVSPVTWGSAKYLFGVDIFLEIFKDYAPGPVPRISNGESLDPTTNFFSGFVFKVQANMDKRHRDRVAFIRICSGSFERGMKVQSMRLNKEIRLAYANQFFAQERETVDTAFAGDIVGVNDTGNLRVGDCVSNGKKVQFGEIPRFAPEHFAKIKLKDVGKRKQLEKAILQFSEEGSIQVFTDPFVGMQDPLIGVVGVLQFEVLSYRLRDEYNIDVQLLPQTYSIARWPRTKDMKIYNGNIKGSFIALRDSQDHMVLFIEREWDLNWIQRENPELLFLTPHQLQ